MALSTISAPQNSTPGHVVGAYRNVSLRLNSGVMSWDVPPGSRRPAHRSRPCRRDMLLTDEGRDSAAACDITALRSIRRGSGPHTSAARPAQMPNRSSAMTASDVHGLTDLITNQLCNLPSGGCQTAKFAAPDLWHGGGATRPGDSASPADRRRCEAGWR
jgi:hypothetical protein